MISAKAKINKPSKKPPATPIADEKNLENSGEPVTQLAFDLKMQIINARLDNSNLLMIGLLIVLAVCFITLFYGYWQFASTSYNDYSQKIKELNEDKYNFLEMRIQELENKKTPLISPTLQPVIEKK